MLQRAVLVGLQYKGERTRGFAMWRSKICGVFRKQMCPGGQFWLVSRIKDRTRGFAMSRSWICDVSMKQRCSSGQFWGVSSIKERAQKSPVLRKAQSRICDVSRKQRWSARQFLWVTSIKERTQGFAMSPQRCLSGSPAVFARACLQETTRLPLGGLHQ